MTKELKIMTEIVEKMMKERQEAVDKVKENLPNTLPHLQLLLEAVQEKIRDLDIDYFHSFPLFKPIEIESDASRLHTIPEAFGSFSQMFCRGSRSKKGSKDDND